MMADDIVKDLNLPQFCFIKQDFFDKYDPDGKLLQNKGDLTKGEGGRPCFFIVDRTDKDIVWCVPVSSQVAKYNNIVTQKISQMQKRGIKNPICHEIAFGKIMGQPRSFLLSNMFPVTAKYIDSYYKASNGKYVTIYEPTANFIRNSAKILLRQAEHGRKVFFADVEAIKTGLLAELEAEGKRSEVPTKPVPAKKVTSSPPKETRDNRVGYGIKIAQARKMASESRKAAQAKEVKDRPSNTQKEH